MVLGVGGGCTGKADDANPAAGADLAVMLALSIITSLMQPF